MSTIARAQSIDDLIGRVSALLDLEITSTSTPSRSQVVRWLNDGALLLAKLLPVERLGGLQTWHHFERVGESLDVEQEVPPIMRIVSVKKYGVYCSKRSVKDLVSTSTLLPLRFTARNPAYAIAGDSGKIRLMFVPHVAGDVSILAISRPSAYEDSDDWSPDDWSMPAVLEPLVVDYAVIQGKIQDEEPQQAAMLLQEWYRKAGIEVKTNVLGGDE